jgi:hypothetical protein
VWSLQSDIGPTLASDATWTTGPVKGNPQLANRDHCETLPDGFSYGRGNGRSFTANGKPTNVIGARQIGNSISISIFVLHQAAREGNEKTAYREEGVVVFTLKPPAK